MARISCNDINCLHYTTLLRSRYSAIKVSDSSKDSGSQQYRGSQVFQQPSRRARGYPFDEVFDLDGELGQVTGVVEDNISQVHLF